jgi:hypothetical protein
VTLAAGLSFYLVAPGATRDRPNESPIANRWSVGYTP